MRWLADSSAGPFHTLSPSACFGILKGGTHFGVLPECGTQHASLEQILAELEEIN